MTDRTAIYTRVSTDEQTAENQEQALRRWAEGRGWDVSDVYSDTGSAFQNADQRELRRLLAHCQQGDHKRVLVYDLSRLTRKGIYDIFRLLENFQQYGVEVIALRQPWTEMPTQMRDIFIALTGWVAQLESEQISARTKAGMERARAAGKHIGRPKGKKDGHKRKQRRI